MGTPGFPRRVAEVGHVNAKLVNAKLGQVCTITETYTMCVRWQSKPAGKYGKLECYLQYRFSSSLSSLREQANLRQAKVGLFGLDKPLCCVKRPTMLALATALPTPTTMVCKKCEAVSKSAILPSRKALSAFVSENIQARCSRSIQVHLAGHQRRLTQGWREQALDQARQLQEQVSGAHSTLSLFSFSRKLTSGTLISRTKVNVRIVSLQSPRTKPSFVTVRSPSTYLPFAQRLTPSDRMRIQARCMRNMRQTGPRHNWLRHVVQVASHPLECPSICLV